MIKNIVIAAQSQDRSAKVGLSRKKRMSQKNDVRSICEIKSSQELQLLSSVTIDCQVTKIVMIPGSQLSVL